MKVIIVGGVAAGASAAARLRRLDESAEIILLERGPAVSYANCGLPYHLGGVISERERLLVTSPAKFKAWFRVDVRTASEAIAIDRRAKRLTVRGPQGEYAESYDKLLLATGAVPVDQPVPGADDPRVMHLWTLSDMDRVLGTLKAETKSAIVVGAGFIGLEVAENLKARGLGVTIIQRGDHVLPTLDAEMAVPLERELATGGIALRLGHTVAAFEPSPAALAAVLDDGTRIDAGFAIVGTGVRPNSGLAQASGLACGPKGHILVDEHMRTSDPDIYAAGDAVEVVDRVFGGQTAIPLAGPANKQGRVAADNMTGRPSSYRGSLGASIVKVGGLTAASIGWTAARLRAAKKDFRVVYVHPSSGASYYPGAARLDLKLLFGTDGAIYGAQIVGAKGVDKRIDTIAVAMRAGMGVRGLAELELAYAPPYSSAKDPVNFAGFVASNVLDGLSDALTPDAIPDDAQLLDVREPEENELGAIPGAVNIPLGQLRGRLGELDRDRLIVTYCQVGLRGYLAERILKQNGFRAADLSGGWITWKMFHPDPPPLPLSPAVPRPARDPAPQTAAAAAPSGASAVPSFGQARVPAACPAIPSEPSPAATLDVRGLACPGPVIRLRAAVEAAAPGSRIHLLAPLTFEGDLLRWAAARGHSVEGLAHKEDRLEADVVKASAQPAAAAPVCAGAPGDSVAIVLFSNDFDRAMAAMILANGFVAAGAKVSVFFTFWGLSVLRKTPQVAQRKDLLSRMFGFMLPNGPRRLALSKLNMMGIGSAMMKNVMDRKGVATLPELIRSAKASGVKFIACEMAMDVLGISREELDGVDEVAGVATFAALAQQGRNALFI